MLDRADIMDISERRQYHGRAGVTQFAWKQFQPKPPHMPDEVEAWRVFGRWIRHLRGARCRLQALLIMGCKDVEYLSKILYYLGGIIRRIRRGQWVSAYLSTEANGFVDNIVTHFSESDFCERVQLFLDEVDGKVAAHAEKASVSWARWANEAFAGGAAAAHRFSRLRERQEVVANTARCQPREQADDCVDQWDFIWAMHGCKAPDLPEDSASWDDLPQFGIDDIRRVIRSFPARTALGQLRLHPRSLDVVSDDGLLTMGLLFVTCERLLCWPADRVHTRLVRLGNLTGGTGS